MLEQAAASLELAAAVLRPVVAVSDQAAAAIGPVVAVSVGHFLLTVYNQIPRDQNRPMAVSGGLCNLVLLLHDLVYLMVAFLVYVRDLAFLLCQRCHNVLVASCSAIIQFVTNNKKQKCPIEGCRTSTVHKFILRCDIVTCARPL